MADWRSPAFLNVLISVDSKISDLKILSLNHHPVAPPEQMPSQSRKNFLLGTSLGIAVGVLLQLIGYLLLRGNQEMFGWSMFVAVPFVSGFAVATIVRSPGRIAACCLTGLAVTFSVMLFAGWEGIICCAMSLPLVATGISAGGILGYQLRRHLIDKMQSPAKATVVVLLLCPLLIAATDRAERPSRSTHQREVFTSMTIVPTTPDRAWDLIAEMKRLEAPLPFLLSVGLPIPTHCKLDNHAVGGQRICYFNNGRIEQEVTHWDRPHLMGLRITKSTLPGRHWLTFLEASYELSAENGNTHVVRHTTIASRLYPRWYWRPLERWGVTSEHHFVFSNLLRWAQSSENLSE